MIAFCEYGAKIGDVLIADHVCDPLDLQRGIFQKLTCFGETVVRYIFQDGLACPLLKNRADIIDGKVDFIGNGIHRHGFSVMLLNVFLHFAYHIGVFSARIFLIGDQNLAEGTEKERLQLADTTAALQLGLGESRLIWTSGTGRKPALQKQEHPPDGIFQRFPGKVPVLKLLQKTVDFRLGFRFIFIGKELLQAAELFLQRSIRKAAGNLRGGGKKKKQRKTAGPPVHPQAWKFPQGIRQADSRRHLPWP